MVGHLPTHGLGMLFGVIDIYIYLNSCASPEKKPSIQDNRLFSPSLKAINKDMKCF